MELAKVGQRWTAELFSVSFIFQKILGIQCERETQPVGDRLKGCGKVEIQPMF